MKKSTKKAITKVDSKTYFLGIKQRATVAMLNLKNNTTNPITDIDIIEKALKNLVFYADKKLESETNKEAKKDGTKA